MLPIFDPAAAMFAPIVRGGVELAAVAVGGMVAVVVLVVRANRASARPRHRVSPIRPRLPAEAA
jgi:hypothetical protein